MEPYTDYSITFNHKFTATGTGEGNWGCQKGELIKFNKITIHLTTCEGEWWGSVIFEHNRIKGLVYNDPGVKCDVEEEFMTELARFHTVLAENSMHGSEMGRQGSTILDMDVSVVNNITEKKLLELGFKVVDT